MPSRWKNQQDSCSAARLSFEFWGSHTQSFTDCGKISHARLHLWCDFPATLCLDWCVVRPYATTNRKCYQIWEFWSSHTKHLQRSVENFSCDSEPTVCCSMQNLTFIDASCCSCDQKQQNGPNLESVGSHVQPFTGHAEIWHGRVNVTYTVGSSTANSPNLRVF